MQFKLKNKNKKPPKYNKTKIKQNQLRSKRKMNQVKQGDQFFLLLLLEMK